MMQSGTLVDKVMNPDPLGDIILDFLMEKRLSEDVYVDYKLTMDVSKKSAFPEIAKDIFALANRGGGWLMFGFSDKHGVIRPVGVPDDFAVDQATLQQKFNSYSPVEIEIRQRIFTREIEVDGKLKGLRFVAFYIPPSQSILKPTRDGKYTHPKTGRTKYAFRKGEVLTRRATQSITASKYEHIRMKKRVEKTVYRLSVLSGKPDEIEETVYGNLLPVLKLPRYMFEARIKGKIPLPKTGREPFRQMGRRIISFCNLSKPPFLKFVQRNTVKRINVASALRDEDKSREIVSLLNYEAISAMRTRQLVFDYKSYKMFYPEKKPPRIESWEGLVRGEIPRKVVWKQLNHSGSKEIFVHLSLRMQFIRLTGKVYLRLEPGFLLSWEGKNPIHDWGENLLISDLTRARFNDQYERDLRFWLCKLPRNDRGEISLGGRVKVSQNRIRAHMRVGIVGDKPSIEQKRGPDRKFTSSSQHVFQSDFIKEPRLIFGDSNEDEDPRIGLKYFGPYHAPDEPLRKEVRLGLIGTGATRDIGKRVLETLKNEQKISKFGKKDHFLFADYPGFNLESSVSCRFVESNSWGATIARYEIDRIVKIENDNERIGAAVDLLEKKVESIAMIDSPPDIILCILPNEIVDECGIGDRTRGAKKRRFSSAEKKQSKLREKGQKFLTEMYDIEARTKKVSIAYDLRDSLKGRIFDYDIPVQFLHQRKAEKLLNYTPSSTTIQDPATFCWNLAMALYYKADGKPWRLAKLEQGTCYVGIAFYRSRLDPLGRLYVSMAQVFTYSGEGLVLRGADVRVDKATKEPHLAENEANDLVSRALSSYALKTGHSPSRVVVHKTSRFSQEEKQGFLKSIGNAKTDFVTINRRHRYSFVRTGSYPVLRGTFIKLTKNEFLLFTSGFIPRLRTYPGHRIPTPLLITMDCDSDPDVVAEEILSLTKINWNTTKFADSQPITIVFPRSVGKVLSELPKDASIKNHYKFYM